MINTIIFQIDGGLGKNVLATAVLKAIKKTYKKANIIVVTAYPDVFKANPNVNKVFNHSQLSGFYEKYIMDKQVKVFIADPYLHTDFITQTKHLIQIWCEMCDCVYEQEMPEMFILKSEKQYFEDFYKRDKPLMAIQPNGGVAGQPLKYSWTRDLPSATVKEVIDYFKKDYDILHIKREDQTIYEHTLQATDAYRSISIALMLSKKRLLIDSSFMHIATALKLPSVVTWVGTDPKIFGYDMHTNIMANKPPREYDLSHPFYQKHLLFEDLTTIPYNNLNEIFDTEAIIKALK